MPAGAHRRCRLQRHLHHRHVRFAGDVVAIIAAETEKAALKAMKLIKVKHEVLEAVLDFRTAKDNPILVHPEDDWFPPCQVGGAPKRNMVVSADEVHGDVEGILAQCDIVLERTYHTKAYNQAMMEPFTVLQPLAFPVTRHCLYIPALWKPSLPL